LALASLICHSGKLLSVCPRRSDQARSTCLGSSPRNFELRDCCRSSWCPAKTKPPMLHR